MKFIITLTLSFLLSGCFYQNVDQYDIQRAVKYCGSVENIVKISANFLGGETAFCFDKPMVELENVSK